MSDSLATILTDTAAKHGDRVAFKLDDAELTYAMLDDGSARIASLLRAKGARARRSGRADAAERARTSRSSTTGSCARAAWWCR